MSGAPQKRLVKKLVIVSATSTSTTRASEEDVTLERVSFIKYQVQFWKDETNTVQALIDPGSEVNAMHPNYAKKLGLPIRKTGVGAQKIDVSSLETFSMVIATLQVQDKLGRSCFFQETLLLDGTSMEVVLGTFFLIFSNVEVEFSGKKLIWRLYTSAKALPTTRRVELIDKKEIAKTALEENIDAFVAHVTSLSLRSKISIHLTREAQIALLLTEEVTIPAEYLYYTDIF